MTRNQKEAFLFKSETLSAVLHRLHGSWQSLNNYVNSAAHFAFLSAVHNDAPLFANGKEKAYIESSDGWDENLQQRHRGLSCVILHQARAAALASIDRRAFWTTADSILERSGLSPCVQKVCLVSPAGQPSCLPVPSVLLALDGVVIQPAGCFPLAYHQWFNPCCLWKPPCA